jgi:hypothetical protein
MAGTLSTGKKIQPNRKHRVHPKPTNQPTNQPTQNQPKPTPLANNARQLVGGKQKSPSA